MNLPLQCRVVALRANFNEHVVVVEEMPPVPKILSTADSIVNSAVGRPPTTFDVQVDEATFALTRVGSIFILGSLEPGLKQQVELAKPAMSPGNYR